jgi:hypothetical protein
MDDALGVRGRQTVCDIRADLQNLPKRERGLVQPLTQRCAKKQFRDRVGDPVVHSEIVNREDVRMRERGHGSGFALETRARRFVSAKVRWKDFDRNLAIQSLVTRAIDLAHSAFTERSHDLVLTKASAWYQAHEIRSSTLR